jgi:hypothetical protein
LLSSRVYLVDPCIGSGSSTNLPPKADPGALGLAGYMRRLLTSTTSSQLSMLMMAARSRTVLGGPSRRLAPHLLHLRSVPSLPARQSFINRQSLGIFDPPDKITLCTLHMSFLAEMPRLLQLALSFPANLVIRVTPVSLLFPSPLMRYFDDF